MSVLFAIAFVLLFSLIGLLVRAGVLQALWGWFVVSTFGLPAISIHVAIGLMLIVGMISPIVDSKSDDTDHPIAKMIGHLILGPLFVLLVGAIIHSMMIQ